MQPEAEEMRRLGYAVVDSVVERWANLGDRHTMKVAARSDMADRLCEPAPLDGRPVDELLERFWRDVEPYAGAIDHPRFFGFIPSSPTWASLLGDWLASGCNFFQGTWLESPGPSQVESVVIDWFGDWFSLPASRGGLLTSGGSVANLLGLAVAREVKLGGLPGDGVAYCSDQAHTAAGRALKVLGFPADRLRTLPADNEACLSPAAVSAALAEDRKAGLRPFCVIASAGTTNTGAVDPLAALADLCAAEDLWLHVDGAYGAFARLTERGRRRLAGIERADSLVLDPHKWLYVGYEAGCLLVRDASTLRRTFRVRPDYLQDLEVEDGGVDYADLGIQLTRRARAIPLWLSIQAHGRRGLTNAIDRTLDLAEEAARLVETRPELQLMAEPTLGITCFRYVGYPALPDPDADAVNEAAVRQIQESGKVVLTSTQLGGRYVVRLCPLNYRSSIEDVKFAVEELVRVAGACRDRL